MSSPPLQLMNARTDPHPSIARPPSAAAASTGARWVPPWASSAQAMRAILLASATATTLKGRRARSCVSQGYFPGILLGAPQYGDRPDDENAPQVAVALFGDRPELLLAPGRILPRHQPDPGREIASRPEDSRVCHRRHDRSRPDNSDARDGLNPLPLLARAILHLDPP